MTSQLAFALSQIESLRNELDRAKQDILDLSKKQDEKKQPAKPEAEKPKEHKGIAETKPKKGLDTGELKTGELTSGKEARGPSRIKDGESDESRIKPSPKNRPKPGPDEKPVELTPPDIPKKGEAEGAGRNIKPLENKEPVIPWSLVTNDQFNPFQIPPWKRRDTELVRSGRFMLSHGDGGAQVFYGSLLIPDPDNPGNWLYYAPGTSGTSPTQFEDTGVSDPNLRVGGGCPIQLGAYGTVYLTWEIDCDTKLPVSVTLEADITEGDWTVEMTDSVNGKYFAKIGEVLEESPVKQWIGSDIVWIDPTTKANDGLTRDILFWTCDIDEADIDDPNTTWSCYDSYCLLRMSFENGLLVFTSKGETGDGVRPMPEAADRDDIFVMDCDYCPPP